MSQHQDLSAGADDHGTPRYEPWLGVSVASFVPLFFSFIVPSAFAIPLLVATGILVVTGAIMLIRQERRRSDKPGMPPAR